MHRWLILLTLWCAPALAADCEDWLTDHPSLSVRQVLRVRNAYAVSAPALTVDRSGQVAVTYLADTGDIPVYSVGDRRPLPTPIWRFPRGGIPLTGENEFIKLVWHINSEGTPVLVVYWIPMHGQNRRQPKLFRAMARLHDRSASFSEFKLPRSGFYEGVHSVRLGEDYIQWTPVNDQPARLISLNQPRRWVSVHETFSGEALMPLGDRLFLARIFRGRIDVLHQRGGPWYPLWSTVCEANCENASLFATGLGQVWLAYTQGTQSVVMHQISGTTRHSRQFNRPIGDVPRFFEDSEGRLKLLVEIEGDGEFTRGRMVSIDVRDPKAPVRVLTPESIFIGESRTFGSMRGKDQFVGMMTVDGLEILNIGHNQRVTHLGRINLPGTQRVGWFRSAGQQYFAIAKPRPEPEIVLFELLNLLDENRP